jgi:hypothetical protein
MINPLSSYREKSKSLKYLSLGASKWFLLAEGRTGAKRETDRLSPLNFPHLTSSAFSFSLYISHFSSINIQPLAPTSVLL